MQCCESLLGFPPIPLMVYETTAFPSFDIFPCKQPLAVCLWNPNFLAKLSCFAWRPTNCSPQNGHCGTLCSDMDPVMNSLNVSWFNFAMIHHVSWGNHPQPQDFRVVNYYKQAKPALFQESSPHGGGFPAKKTIQRFWGTQHLSGWWFGTWLLFSISYMGQSQPHWLSYFSEG